MVVVVVAVQAVLARCGEEPELRTRVLDEYEAEFGGHREAIDDWLAAQACCGLPNARARLEALTRHKSFSLTNPNKVTPPSSPTPTGVGASSFP